MKFNFKKAQEDQDKAYCKLPNKKIDGIDFRCGIDGGLRINTQQVSSLFLSYEDSVKLTMFLKDVYLE